MKKFAAHRWVENVPVLERLLEVLPSLKKYIAAGQKKFYTDLQTKSFGILNSEYVDPLLATKLNFALTIAKQIQLFLTIYLGDQPLLPFLVTDLFDIKVDDFSDANKHKQVDLGYAAEKIVCKLRKKNLNESDLFSIRRAAKKSLITLVPN